MRLAVIADCHGNDLALEAVLSDLDRQGVREIVNLGDHLSGPLNAARTADLLMARPMTSIRGNHDRALSTINPSRMIASDRAAHAQLDEHHHRWLAALPLTATLWDGAIFLCHGTPLSDETYWLETVSEAGLVHAAPVGVVAQQAAAADAAIGSATLLLCGHTHRPRLVRLPDGRLVLNPGSVGCPAYADDHPVPHRMSSGTPHASYAIIERRDGSWDVTFRLVSYDHQAMATLASARGRPDWAEALATGWLEP